MPDSQSFDTTMLDDIKSYAPHKLEMFLSTALGDLQRHYNGVQLAKQVDDIKSIELHMHSIKSVAGQFGAKKLAGICDKIEDAAMNDKRDICEELRPSFEDEYKIAIRFFENYAI